MTSMGFRGLYYRHHDWLTGRSWTFVIEDDRCWKCGAPNPDLAHTVNEYVAAVLGDAAIAEHEAAHGCARPGWSSSCAAVLDLWQLLPEDMQPVVIG